MLEGDNVCFGEKFIPWMEVGYLLLCKNKGTFIAKKLYGQQERGVHSQFLWNFLPLSL
jgi:hypothetical protein